MYLNRITLIGFIGSDTERKAANATNIAVFSLATKTSRHQGESRWSIAQHFALHRAREHDGVSPVYGWPEPSAGFFVPSTKSKKEIE
jgi:hypothetical protein